MLIFYYKSLYTFKIIYIEGRIAMNKASFIKDFTNYLEIQHIPYRLDFKSDISINTSFKNNDDNDEIFLLMYLLVDDIKNTVFIYQNVRTSNNELTDDIYYRLNIITDESKNQMIMIGSIIDNINVIANDHGLIVNRTNDVNKAQYPKMSTNKKRVVNHQPTSKKLPIGLIAGVIIILIGIVIIASIFLKKDPNEEQPEEYINDPTNNKTINSQNNNENDSSDKNSDFNSAIVSIGVNEQDLGNIMSGQYYFATNEFIFYSSYDENNTAHIYSVKTDKTELTPIFDGFGWSLVVINDWLYFSGNQGAVIDGSYHIFRMKLDGSQLQKIHDRYSYGMFIYGDYLYYMTSNVDYPESMSIARSSLDGSNKEILFEYGYNPLIYKDQLYYFDNQGNMYKTDPDGSNPEVLISAAVKSYTISKDKIIYNDFGNNINICDINGDNNKVIRATKGEEVLNVNAYKDRIYFSEYNTEFNYTYYGYDYTIFSINMDGSNERSLFTSVSYGIYMNLVNDKLMLMDYTRSGDSDTMVAVIKTMDLDGSNISVMER